MGWLHPTPAPLENGGYDTDVANLSISLDVVIGSGKATWLTPNQWESALRRSQNSWETFYILDLKLACVIVVLLESSCGESLLRVKPGQEKVGPEDEERLGPPYIPWALEPILPEKALTLELQLVFQNKYPISISQFELGFYP